MKRLIVLVLGLTGLLFSLGSSCYSNNIDELNNAILAKGARWVAREASLSNEEWGRWDSTLEESNLSGMPVDNSFYRPLAMPSSFDWTHHNGNYVTSVKNQNSPNQCGSCWAFAPVAALESKVLISNGTPWVDLDLSEQILLSCSGAGGCPGGSVGTAANFLRSTGTYLESCFPYIATEADCNQGCTNWQANAYRIEGWSLVVNGSNGPASLSAIKNALYTNGPVIALFDVYEDLKHYGGGVYSYVSGNFVGNHAILVVGWDDSTRAFKCKNSRGPEWGEEGFLRISYDELYGTGKTQFGRMVYAFGNVLQNPITTGPDLTGEWKTLKQTCKRAAGQPCKISGTLKISNQGNENVSSFDVDIYLSGEEGYLFLGRTSGTKLKIKGNKVLKINYTLPPGQNGSGKRVVAVLDSDDAIVEMDEKNNVVPYGPLP